MHQQCIAFLPGATWRGTGRASGSKKCARVITKGSLLKQVEEDI